MVERTQPSVNNPEPSSSSHSPGVPTISSTVRIDIHIFLKVRHRAHCKSRTSSTLSFVFNEMGQFCGGPVPQLPIHLALESDAVNARNVWYMKSDFFRVLLNPRRGPIESGQVPVDPHYFAIEFLPQARTQLAPQYQEATGSFGKGFYHFQDPSLDIDARELQETTEYSNFLPRLVLGCGTPGAHSAYGVILTTSRSLFRGPRHGYCQDERNTPNLFHHAIGSTDLQVLTHLLSVTASFMIRGAGTARNT